MSTCRDGLGIASFPCCWGTHPRSPTPKSIPRNQTSKEAGGGRSGLSLLDKSSCSENVSKSSSRFEVDPHKSGETSRGINALKWKAKPCQESSPPRGMGLGNPFHNWYTPRGATLCTGEKRE